MDSCVVLLLVCPEDGAGDAVDRGGSGSEEDLEGTVGTVG